MDASALGTVTNDAAAMATTETPASRSRRIGARRDRARGVPREAGRVMGLRPSCWVGSTPVGGPLAGLGHGNRNRQGRVGMAGRHSGTGRGSALTHETDAVQI